MEQRSQHRKDSLAAVQQQEQDLAYCTSFYSRHPLRRRNVTHPSRVIEFYRIYLHHYKSYTQLEQQHQKQTKQTNQPNYTASLVAFHSVGLGVVTPGCTTKLFRMGSGCDEKSHRFRRIKPNLSSGGIDVGGIGRLCFSNCLRAALLTFPRPA